jgi:hypothetical protein
MNEESLPRPYSSEAAQLAALPNRRPDRMWGGPGSGAGCGVCGKPIEPHQVELELEFDVDGQAGEAHRLHGRCFSTWQSMWCLEAGDAQDVRPAGGLTGSLRDGNMSPGDTGGRSQPRAA